MPDPVFLVTPGRDRAGLVLDLDRQVIELDGAAPPSGASIVAVLPPDPRAWLVKFLRLAIDVLKRDDVVAAVPVDGAGYEVEDVWVGRADALPMRSSRARRGYVPVPIGDYASDEELRQAHRAEAEQYRDRIGDRILRPANVEADKRHLVQDDLQRLGRILEIPVRGPLLDVGCSDGTVLLEMVRRWNVERAVGIDVAESAVGEAREAAAADPDLRGRVSFRCGFIEDLDDPDGTFTTVSACETLEHMAAGQLEPALGALLRVLAADGDMLVTVPNRYPSAAYEEAGRARWLWPAHHQFFSEVSLRAMLEPHFATLRFLPHHDGDATDDGIYLICHAQRRRP